MKHIWWWVCGIGIFAFVLYVVYMFNILYGLSENYDDHE